jgi:Helicase conserved C-terminal domain
MTLRLDPALDLGRDSERMTPEDTRRQVATANWLLKAFSEPLPGRREVQLLADEVGLGKTFVALAAAYSLLRAVRTQPEVADEVGLGKCYRAAVVVVPSGNHALARKWHQEVEALRTRCSTAPKETDWFQSRICDNAYELVEGLRRASDLRRNARRNPCVLICTANVFSKKVPDVGERLRFLAACLFRWWGNRLSIHERFRIVTRAADVRGFSGWAQFARRVGTADYEVDLWNFRDHEDYLTPAERQRGNWPEDVERLYEQTPFSYSDVTAALESFYRTEEGQAILDEETLTSRDGYEEPAGLLPYCKDAAQRRGHAEWYFHGFKARLLGLYKELAHHLIRQDVPLVIVDEAHHWRHSHRKDCQSFRDRLAPIARRLLLLTATPFQLHRDELLEVLSVGDAMESAIGEDRGRYLRKLRERIQEATAVSEAAGVAFSREWGSLPEQFARVDPRFDTEKGVLPSTTDPRTEELARLWAAVAALEPGNGPNWSGVVPGPLRPFFARARELQASNDRLGAAMRTLIIRHRRSVAHRHLLIGREYPASADGPTRPDQHLLHLAPGACIPPHAELAQYLLMKVVADASRGKHRTTLGMDLTGCYTTLWESREGEKAAEAATRGNNQRLFRILQQLTGHREGKDNREDARHPKLQIVLEEVLRRWDQGEKTLLFCFRVPTARTLARLLARGVEQRLRRSRRALLESRGTEATAEADIDRAMQQFRRSLTARDGSGVPLFLDRVLLGRFQALGLTMPMLTDVDRKNVAALYARARVAGSTLFRGGDRLRLDRVFLNRAIEQVWAARLLNERSSWWPGRPTAEREETKFLLERIADEAWIRFRYGIAELSRRRGEADGDTAPTDFVARSSLSGWYDLDSVPADEAAKVVEEALNAAPPGGRMSLVDTLVAGPNLLVPVGPEVDFLGTAGRERADRMRDLLFRMTVSQGAWEWGERAKVLDAVVRALLREDILLRLPRNVFRDADETWAAGILRGLHEPPGSGQLEPLAGRVEEFLGELIEMGPTEREAHLRYAMNPKAEAVVLVTGESGIDRDAVFNGFNTPLLPDILVCTQVGQEGIDLHRHCRHVVHYDLGWNPATLEQRTGRTDRLGSKALRERSLALAAQTASERCAKPGAAFPGLDIALPYLAGTYDERVYDRLRSRAQTFEILTGGDPSADSGGETNWLDPDDVGSPTGTDYVALPNDMLAQLRVNLSVEAG